jgi:hypothetical protein
MRLPLQAATALSLCVVVSALAGPPAKASAAAPARLAGEVACDVILNVHDPDPKGLNVRAAPGKPPGKVIKALVPDGEWTEVHVVGQSGDWLRIDLASTVDDDAPEGMREVFRGNGWVHVSGLGISELMTGEGTILRASPSDAAKLLKKIGPDDEPKRTRILGCSGKFLHVDADGLVAWTRQYCTNERTTCS